MKWSVKSYSLWNAGLQFFTEQTCGQRCEGILKVLRSGEGGILAHTLMRGSLLSSQPVTFLVETNPGLATLSHYTMSAILSQVWPSQGKPHRCWANDKHYEMYLSWNQVLMVSSGHTEVVSPPLILQYDQESICSIGDVDNAWYLLCNSVIHPINLITLDICSAPEWKIAACSPEFCPERTEGTIRYRPNISI